MSLATLLQCPACGREYLLPRPLLGALGARVTCPSCRAAFDVDAAGVPLPVPAGAAGPPFAARFDAHADERSLARDVLDEFAARRGPGVERAAAAGRLFRDHGPALLEAFDEFRRRSGGDAGTRAFREELLRRWHVDLFPRAEARGAVSARGA
jgi:hypothetical protein